MSPVRRPRFSTLGASCGAGLALLWLTAGMSGYNAFLLSAVGCYTLGALSILVLTGWAGQISLAQTAFMGFGAFAVGVLGGVDEGGSARLPFAAALLLVPLVCAIVAVLVGLPAVRIRGIHLALLTLALAYALDVLVFTQGNFTRIVEQLTVTRPAAFGVSMKSDRAYAYLIWTVVGFASFALWAMSRSQFGRILRSVRDSEVASSIMGVNVTAVKLAAFALAGALAGLGGALYGGLVGNVYSVFRSFDVLHSLLLTGIVVVGGGLVNIRGAIVGGALYVYGPEWMGNHFSQLPPELGAGIGLIVVAFASGRGLSVLVSDAWSALVARIRPWLPTPRATSSVAEERTV